MFSIGSEGVGNHGERVEKCSIGLTSNGYGHGLFSVGVAVNRH